LSTLFFNIEAYSLKRRRDLPDEIDETSFIILEDLEKYFDNLKRETKLI